MTTNFKIIDFREIELNGRLIDVHNNFDFMGVEIGERQEIITLKWQRADGNWVPHNELQSFKIVHKPVSYFFDTSPDNENADGCLSEMSFYPSSDRTANDSFLDQETPTAWDDIVYTFQGGRIIRLCCEEVCLVAFSDA